MSNHLILHNKEIVIILYKVWIILSKVETKTTGDECASFCWVEIIIIILYEEVEIILYKDWIILHE